ncbi:hypothetical protein GCM10009534_55150 [Kribbella sandramycini]
MPPALLAGLLATLLTPALLLVRTALRRLALLGLLRRTLAPALCGLALLRLRGLLRLTGLRPTGLLAPTATTLLRRLPLLGLRLLRLGLLRLTPAATALGRRLLSPAALPSLSPLLSARLAPRLPRTPRSLRRRRHICSF